MHLEQGYTALTIHHVYTNVIRAVLSRKTNRSRNLIACLMHLLCWHWWFQSMWEFTLAWSHTPDILQGWAQTNSLISVFFIPLLMPKNAERPINQCFFQMNATWKLMEDICRTGTNEVLTTLPNTVFLQGQEKKPKLSPDCFHEQVWPKAGDLHTDICYLFRVNNFAVTFVHWIWTYVVKLREFKFKVILMIIITV